QVDRRYIAAEKPEGMYPLMYYNHNLQFAAFAWTIAGAHSRALVDAKEVTANGEAVVKDVPFAELVTNTTLVVETRFRQWDAVRAIPEPAAGMPATRVFWNWAQGMRLASTGDVAGARAQLDSLRAHTARIPADYVFGLNPGRAVLSVAEAQLAARIAEGEHRTADAIAGWREACAREDSLSYDEPPDWYAFSRESLGGAMLRSGDAGGAADVFRSELTRHPNNPRALFGLARALEAAGRKSEADKTDAEYQKAARKADVTFSVAGL
ncbi:MAG: tetratricopeptide repeat protein, partial [Candidatus Eisenbacteria bacterium]